MFELQVIYWGHFVLPVLNISWICETKMNTIYFSFFRFIVCTHLSLFEAHLAGGSPRPPASYTESRSNSEGWFGCNGPKRARPTGSSSECPYHCFQRTTGQERKLRQGKMRETSCMVSEKWYHFRWPHPVSISIVDGGPFSAVVAESQEVGRHVVTPETRQHVGSMWVCGFFFICLCLFCFLLVQGVSSLCYDSCELRLPASVQLKPVDPVLWVCTPRSTSHVIFIIWALGTTEATNTCCCMQFLTQWVSQ